MPAFKCWLGDGFCEKTCGPSDLVGQLPNNLRDTMLYFNFPGRYLYSLIIIANMTRKYNPNIKAAKAPAGAKNSTIVSLNLSTETQDLLRSIGFNSNDPAPPTRSSSALVNSGSSRYDNGGGIRRLNSAEQAAYKRISELLDLQERSDKIFNTKEEEEPEVVTFIPVYDSELNVYIDESNVYRPGPPNREVCWHPVGSTVVCSSGGPGGFFVNSKGSKNIKSIQVEPPGRFVTLEEASILIGTEVHHYEKRTYLVLTKLFEKLVGMYRTTTLTSQLIKGLYSIRVAHPFFDVTDTIEYFLHATVASMQCATSVINLRLTGQQVVADVNLPSTERLNNQCTYLDPCDRKYFHQRVTPVITYPVRKDFTVIKTTGFPATYEYEHVPKFSDVPIPFELNDDHYSTRQMSLWGHGGDFIMWGRHPNVLDNALSRLFEPRPCEVSLRSRGYLFALKIVRKFKGLTLDEAIKEPIMELGSGGMYKVASNPDLCLKREFWPESLDPERAEMPDSDFYVPIQFNYGFSSKDYETAVDYAADIQVRRIDRCGRRWWWMLADVVMTATVRIYYLLLMEGAYLLWTYLTRRVTVHAPHKKRNEYIEYFNGEAFHPSGYNTCRQGEVAIKPDEQSKPDGKGSFKPGRVVVQYKSAALTARESIALCKILYSVMGMMVSVLPNSSVTHVHMTITKPGMILLRDAFTELCSSRVGDHVVTINHSDDGCIKVCKGFSQEMGNTDVSSNDKGQPISSFVVVYYQLAHFCAATAWACMLLCVLPFKVTSIVKGKGSLAIKAQAVFQFKGFQQGSGLAATTNINDAGNSAGLAATASLLFSSVDKTLEQCVEAGFGFVGHRATFQRCDTYAGIQFLKFSPFENGGFFYPWGNMGKLIKGLGSCLNDLTSEMCGVTQLEFSGMGEEERWNIFCANVIEGWKYEPHNPLLDALRERFPSHSARKSIHMLEQIKDSPEVICVSSIEHDLSNMDATVAFELRYGIDENELVDLLLAVKEISAGKHYNLVAARKIMHVDYGYPLWISGSSMLT